MSGVVRSLNDVHRSAPTTRVPPQDLQAEAALIGAALLSPAARAAAGEVGIRADEFYRPANGHIWEAIVRLDSRSEPVDPVTVADELARAGLLDATGGAGELVAMQADTPATSGAARYAAIVRDMAQLRRMIATAGEIAEIGYGLPDDVSAAIDRAEGLMFAVGETERNSSDSIVPLAEMLEAGMRSLTERYDRGAAITGVPSGFIDLDTKLCGLQPGDLVILGARPAMGKSSMALDVARHVAVDQGRPALFFSLEMSLEQITQRILATEARVDLQRIRSGRLHEADWEKLAAASQRLAAAPLLVDTRRDLTITEARAKARRTKSRHGDLGLVVIDYLQLLSSETRVENRQIEVDNISRGAKILAGELDVPVLALSQLSRNLESRADKRPILSDLRESGALEAHSDVVMFLYRDEVYDETTTKRGVAEVIVAKQRNGPIGTVEVAFLEHHAHFANMAHG